MISFKQFLIEELKNINEAKNDFRFNITQIVKIFNSKDEAYDWVKNNDVTDAEFIKFNGNKIKVKCFLWEPKINETNTMTDEERKRYHDLLGVGHHVWKVNYDQGRWKGKNVELQTKEKSEDAVKKHHFMKGKKINSIRYIGVREAPE